jgi:lipopolysaccharide assembly outer membrane protein LptD (OstA)
LDWDAGTKNVYTDADVSIKKAAFEVNGKGAVCDLENNTAELKQDITANIAPPETGMLRTTIITCDGPLELNYNKNRAIFRNNVRVEDSEGNIYADRIDVYFNPTTRRIKCVVAKGNVEIVNGENVSYSEKAIYLVDEGRVVLPNKPRLVIQSEQ